VWYHHQPNNVHNGPRGSKDFLFFYERVLFNTADGNVNRTGQGGENYGESSANDSLLQECGPGADIVCKYIYL
jgi:hypothetical protein